MPRAKRRQKTAPATKTGHEEAELHIEADDNPTAPCTQQAAPAGTLTPLDQTWTFETSSTFYGDEACRGYCCQRGKVWLRTHYLIDQIREDPSIEALDTYAWGPVSGGVSAIAGKIWRVGLAPWAELQPAVRDKMRQWSPVAQQLVSKRWSLFSPRWVVSGVKGLSKLPRQCSQIPKDKN